MTGLARLRRSPQPRAIAKTKSVPARKPITLPNKKALVHLGAGLVLWLLWFLLLWGAVSNAAGLAGTYAATSLRYATGLTAEQAAAARRAAAKDEANTVWPHFWAEESHTLESELGGATAPVLFFDGQASLVYPADFVAGSYPGAFEQDGAAVSTALAWKLWGGTDVLGRQFLLGGKAYTVGGVFSGEDALALVNLCDGAPSGGWKAVELEGTADDEAYGAAKEFAGLAGLTDYTAIVCGNAFTGLARLAAMLPGVLLCIAGLVQLLRWWSPRRTTAQIVLAVAGLALALALPALLAALPGWVIPSRWSDFSHWSGLWSTGMAQLKQYLMLAPAGKDGLARLYLLKQMGLLAAALPVSLPLCYRLGHNIENALRFR